MSTPADALEVMTVVAACHHRTAPRLDDREAVLATASIWAELFTVHQLDLPDLIAAVKRRAAGGHVDAPEPAEIITVARQIRRDRDAQTGPTPAYQVLCESKAEDHAELEANRRRLAGMVGAIAERKAIDHA